MSSSPPTAERVPPGLKVTLYHWEKSLRRGGETNLQSPAVSPPGATPHLFIGTVMSEAHACWQSLIFYFIFLFFAEFLPLHNWLFSTIVT